jgi:uncharacterized protein YebE (UPF0316 family)
MKAARITLDYIEIGNEPDLYINNGLRNLSWGVTQYIKEFVKTI